jgi:CheY-like chemotaxis protein
MYAECMKLGAWDVEEAADGREALAKAIGRRPQVVVTEPRLPGISGYDLCSLLKRDSSTRAIPIVFVAGDGQNNDVELAHHSGADVVLTEPCRPETLLAEIRHLIRFSEVQSRSSGHERNSDPVTRSGHLLERVKPNGRRLTLSRAHRRHDTVSPPLKPPSLVCPSCDQSLVYQRSHIGGVSVRHPEQWDYYTCPAGCGTFQYRERTRRLRRVT